MLAIFRDGLATADLPKSNADALSYTARELVVRGPPYSEAERRILADAWPELAKAPLRDGWDAVLAQECLKHYKQQRAALVAPVYAGVTPFDTRIVETEKELAMAAAAELAARGAWEDSAEFVRRDMLQRRRNEPSTGLVEQREAAGDRHREAEQHFTRLRSRLTALEVARSHWRAEQEP